MKKKIDLLTHKRMGPIRLGLVLYHYLRIHRHLLHCRHKFSYVVQLVVLTTSQTIEHPVAELPDDQLLI